MKKVINVNLAGKAFTIDEDAYTELNQYLNNLERHFSRSQGSEDIIYDIEARIAELFEEDRSGGNIVSMLKVDNMKSTMGMPEDFASDEKHDYTDSSDKKKKTKKKKSTGHSRRLFRDPDNKVFGGVASGLSAYFGIKDPIILRIIILLLFFGFGTGLFIYVILWIAIPEAKTSSDFLAMRGEDINIDNIARTVEDGFNDLKDKFEEFGKDLKTRVL
jgi:phage shock protein PspC (stress-responsive transcriptional regulator)